MAMSTNATTPPTRVLKSADISAATPSIPKIPLSTPIAIVSNISVAPVAVSARALSPSRKAMDTSTTSAQIIETKIPPPQAPAPLLGKRKHYQQKQKPKAKAPIVQLNLDKKNQHPADAKPNKGNASEPSKTNKVTERDQSPNISDLESLGFSDDEKTSKQPQNDVEAQKREKLDESASEDEGKLKKRKDKQQNGKESAKANISANADSEKDNEKENGAEESTANKRDEQDKTEKERVAKLREELGLSSESDSPSPSPRNQKTTSSLPLAPSSQPSDLPPVLKQGTKRKESEKSEKRKTKTAKTTQPNSKEKGKSKDVTVAPRTHCYPYAHAELEEYIKKQTELREKQKKEAKKEKRDQKRTRKEKLKALDNNTRNLLSGNLRAKSAKMGNPLPLSSSPSRPLSSPSRSRSPSPPPLSSRMVFSIPESPVQG